MFYKMIENKCREWYHSEECTVHSLVEYIEKTGKMRDAQVEAIKLYLFLKIGCGCKPLELLFRQWKEGCRKPGKVNGTVVLHHMDILSLMENWKSMRKKQLPSE